MWLEQLGVNLRTRPVRNYIKRRKPRSMIDLGCGHSAELLRAVGDAVPRRIGVDFDPDKELGARENIELIDGAIESVLPTIEPESIELVTMISVLEHLPEPQQILEQVHGVLAPGGSAWIHVPSWLGKPILEYIAFKRGIGTDSINDHRNYYSGRQLWPMAIKAGFQPKNVSIRHPMGGVAVRLEATRG